MRITTLTLLAATLVAVAWLTVGFGQGPVVPAVAAESGVQATSKKSFAIPVDVKPERRADIDFLQLFVSRDQGQLWELMDQQPPAKESLTFSAKEDGMYWVNMVIKYKNGKLDPPDVSRVQPAQKFIIDTTPPVVKVTAATRTGEDVSVEWTVDDKFPNDASTAVYVRSATTPEAQWQQAPAEAVVKRSAKFKTTIPGPLVVMVATADLAKNQGSAMKEVLAATNTSGYTPPRPPPVVGGGPVYPKDDGLPKIKDDILPPPPGPASGTLPPPMNFGGPVEPPGPPAVAEVTPKQVPPPAVTPQPLQTLPVDPFTQGTTFPPRAEQLPIATGNTPQPAPVEQVPKPIASGGGPDPMPRLQPTAAVQPGPAELPPIQVVRFTRFDLGYQVDGGVSGVSKVHLYVTRDDGRSWKPWSVHDGKESPLKVVLDTQFNQQLEGDYGFKLVAVSGAGLSDPAPTAGTVPEMKVHVDLTAPVIKVFQPKADPNNRSALVLQWEATDKNFGRDPIMIEYSETAGGPWKSVATADPSGALAVGNAVAGTRIANTGSYSWQPPPLTNPQVYLRVTAWDLGGNKSEAVTQKPIVVDLLKPTARIQGIVATPPGR